MQLGMMNMQPGQMLPGMMKGQIQPGQMGMMNGQMENSHGQIYPTQMMGIMNGLQSGQMVMSQRQMQPIQMMGIINDQIQLPGQMQNQSQGGNNPNTKPKSQPSKNMCIEFLFDPLFLF